MTAPPGSGGGGVDLLGGRGALGRTVAGRLARDFQVASWSGAADAHSYEAFALAWRTRPAAAHRAVVLAHGSSSGTVSDLVRGFVLRTAEFVDLFERTRWPDRVVLLGSASELLPGSAYGAAKRAQRDVAETAATRAGVPVVTLRVHSLVPDDLPTRGIFRDLLEGFRGGAVRVRHLAGLRDYVAEEQLAAAVRAALLVPAERLPRVLDVGTGVGRGVPWWLDGFRAAFGRERELVVTQPDARDEAVIADAGPVEALVAETGGPDALARWRAATPDAAACAARWRRLCG